LTGRSPTLPSLRAQPLRVTGRHSGESRNPGSKSLDPGDPVPAKAGSRGDELKESFGKVRVTNVGILDMAGAKHGYRA
jgi:hypothetical protein